MSAQPSRIAAASGDIWGLRVTPTLVEFSSGSTVTGWSVHPTHDHGEESPPSPI